MNAIISLCHFCELHGPSVILCTQAFHAPEADELNNTEVFVSNDSETCKKKDGPSSLDSFLHPSSVKVQPNKSATTSAPSSPTHSLPEKAKPDVCEACTPFAGSKLGFVSHDSETRFYYTTTHHPRHPEVYGIVRHSCLRSLSCEISPDPGCEGPIFFGDEQRSQVLSYVFRIDDSQARGQQQMYSITVVMMDKTFLLNSWPFLVKHIRILVEDVKTKANAIFLKETVRNPSRSCIGRVMTPTTTSTSFRLQRGTNKPTRSLTELTGDKLIFNRLHSYFAWMLKAGGVRLTERLLEGPPSEACVLDTSRLEETEEEGFIKVYSKVGMKVDVKIHRHVESDPTPAATMSTLFCQLRQFAKLLGRSRFHVVAHHVLIGNQVVVRSKCKLTAHTILDSLKILLPKGCCRTEYFSDTYVPSYKYNFLGVQSSVDVPVNTSLCILVDVLYSPVDDQDDIVVKSLPSDVSYVPDERTREERASVLATAAESSLSGPHSLMVRVGSAEEIVDLSMIQYRVLHTPTLLPSKEPSLLGKVERVLFSDSFADSVAERSLQCLKDDWMMKVKRMFMFMKFGETRTAEEMNKFFEVIGASEDDKMALKFWMSGLPGVEYQLNNSSTTLSADTEYLSGYPLS